MAVAIVIVAVVPGMEAHPYHHYHRLDNGCRRRRCTIPDARPPTASRDTGTDPRPTISGPTSRDRTMTTTTTTVDVAIVVAVARLDWPTNGPCSPRETCADTRRPQWRARMIFGRLGRDFERLPNKWRSNWLPLRCFRLGWFRRRRRHVQWPLRQCLWMPWNRQHRMSYFCDQLLLLSQQCCHQSCQAGRVPHDHIHSSSGRRHYSWDHFCVPLHDSSPA
mmetsp:Transcript_5451/g.15365  ORF Transcript_5451/g.15365 Transcript_5451/m.15365 type:complete len:220 (+) Transcript_5451:223-882(+)